MGYIYKITTPDGKSYIGQTIRDVETRVNEHIKDAKLYKQRCILLEYAIRRYVDELTVETLLVCDNDKTDYYETQMIKIYDTLSPNGLNMNTGGGMNRTVSKDVVYNHDSNKIMEYRTKNIVNYKRTEVGKSLPMYVSAIKYKDRYVYRVIGHPLSKCCKSFNSAKYDSDDAAIEAAKQYITDLESNNTLKLTNKAHDLPKGIKLTPNGYVGCVTIKGNVYQKRFGLKSRSDEENLNMAIEYVNAIRSTYLERNIEPLPNGICTFGSHGFKVSVCKDGRNIHKIFTRRIYTRKENLQLAKEALEQLTKA